MASEWFCRWTDRERQALPGLGPLARAMYEVLRFQMDYTTGLVGRRTPISWNGLAHELRTDTPRGRGHQTTRPTLQEMRTAVERLIRAGLLKRVGGEDFLSFLCPFAFIAPVRPFHTQQSGNSPQSTEPNRRETSNGEAFEGFEDSPDSGDVSLNSTHIRDVWMCTPPQSSSTDLTGVDAGDAGAGEGPNRDRASPSQAGQLTQPGNTHNDPYRDRPAGSHPAPGRRLDCGALPGDAPIQLRDGETGECSAESESTPDAVGAPDGARVEALTAVLVQRSIRVPADGVVVADWAARGVTPLELDQAVAKALAARAKEGSLQPIGVGYVSAVIQSERSAVKRAAAEARRAVEQGPRRAKDSDLEGLAKSVGMWPAPLGMSMPEFRHRVMNAVADQVGRRG